MRTESEERIPDSENRNEQLRSKASDRFELEQIQDSGFAEFLQRLEQILAMLVKHNSQNAKRCLMQKSQGRQGWSERKRTERRPCEQPLAEYCFSLGKQKRSGMVVNCR